MFLKSIITGSAITAILVSVLAATRLMKSKNETPYLLFYEVKQVTMTPPLEPLIEEDEQAEEILLDSLPQAPIPALDLLENSSIDSTPLPLTTASFTPELSVSPFEIDRRPADLPVITSPSKLKPRTKSVTKLKSKTILKPRPKITRVPRKSMYPPSYLDSPPRELRKGSFSWPQAARGNSGTVKLRLEIDTAGRVKVLGVESTTDSRLNNAAKRVATNSRFTAPTHQGRPVKTTFLKKYTLKKPRR